MSTDILVALGSDAFANNFDIIIPPFQGNEFVSLNIRTQTFTIPRSGSETYDRRYKTQRILLTTNQVTLEKTFTINFTVDEFFNEYRKLRNWKNLVMDTKTGIPGPLIALKVPVTVLAYSAGGIVPTNSWIFEGARCISIGDVSFSRGSADPITVDATFAYDNFDDKVFTDLV
jgi:hypothetical protein